LHWDMFFIFSLALSRTKRRVPYTTSFGPSIFRLFKTTIIYVGAVAAFYKWWCGSGPPGLNLLGWSLCVCFALMILARFMAIASFATWFESSENRLGFLLSVVVGLRLRVSVLAHTSRTKIMHNKHLKLGMIYLIMLPALVNIVLLLLLRSSKSDIFVIYRSSIFFSPYLYSEG